MFKQLNPGNAVPASKKSSMLPAWAANLFGSKPPLGVERSTQKAILSSLKECRKIGKRGFSLYDALMQTESLENPAKHALYNEIRSLVKSHGHTPAAKQFLLATTLEKAEGAKATVADCLIAGAVRKELAQSATADSDKAQLLEAAAKYMQRAGVYLDAANTAVDSGAIYYSLDKVGHRKNIEDAIQMTGECFMSFKRGVNDLAGFGMDFNLSRELVGIAEKLYAAIPCEQTRSLVIYAELGQKAVISNLA
jgi:hypothetical protein